MEPVKGQHGGSRLGAGKKTEEPLVQTSVLMSIDLREHCHTQAKAAKVSFSAFVRGCIEKAEESTFVETIGGRKFTITRCACSDGTGQAWVELKDGKQIMVGSVASTNLQEWIKANP